LDGNARTLEQLLDVAAMGKGKRNIIRRADLEQAASLLGKSNDGSDGESHYRPSVDGERLAKAISTILGAGGETKKWLELSRSDTDGLDESLRGSLPQIISTLIEWSLFRAKDAPAVVSYMTGQKTKGRTPEDFLRRLLKLDPKISDAIVRSPHFPDNARLKEIINSCSRKGTYRSKASTESD
jgi:hypothetical protein